MFVKDSKTVILMKKGHQHDAEGGISKKFLLHGLVNQNLGNWNRFMLIKVEIHILSNDLRRNL
jgi:hypothetical protein